MNQLNHEIGTCQQKRTGKPNLPFPKLTQEQLERFLSKIDKNGQLPDQDNSHYKGLDRCWVWTAYKDKGGYGCVNINGIRFSSHRVSKNIFQPFDPSLQALHKCDNPTCLNPDHIFLGNPWTNHRDKEQKNRGNQNKGSRHTLSKLTEENILEIRKLRISGMILKDIAKKFNVSFGLICAITNNKIWKHVK